MVLIGFGSAMSQYESEVIHQRIGAAGEAWESAVEYGRDFEAVVRQF